MEQELRRLIVSHPEWRKNALAFSRRYLDEGLKDRAITRSLEWGIRVPKAGFEDKRIYIWAENVLGYLSMSKLVCQEKGISFEKLWGAGAKHYYIHGKDNIPFHTIILPALLIAHGTGLRLPDTIISSEYLTLEGRKISTSQNRAVWLKDIAYEYQADSLRYFFIINNPEKRDGDFSWQEYRSRHNNELLGAYGNLVNRTLVFINKYFDGEIWAGNLTPDIQLRIEALYGAVGRRIEAGDLKDGLAAIFELIRWSNRYYDRMEPWKTRTENPAGCRAALFDCLQIIGNLAVLLHPFLPFSSAQVLSWLALGREWKPQFVPPGHKLPETEVLFKRLS